MKKAVLSCFLCIVFGFVAVYSGHCENIIVNGQVVDESGSPVINSTEIEPLDATGSLNFDNIAPCSFADAVPIPPTFYKHFGFTLKGPDANSGGAVLNECSGFPVTGHSSPNFLAFDCASVLSTGGVPFLPEKLIFTTPVGRVSLNIGGGDSIGESVTLTAKTALGRVVDTQTVILAPALTTVNLTSTKPNIKRVIITLPPGSKACTFAIDDIVTN
jgi:hypothetical protein